MGSLIFYTHDKPLKTYAVIALAHIICVAKQKKLNSLGPVFRPSINSDRYRFLIPLFQSDILTLSGQNKITKICQKYLFDLSSYLINSALNTEK